MVLTDFEVEFQYITSKINQNALLANAFFKICLWGKLNIFDAVIMFKIKHIFKKKIKALEDFLFSNSKIIFLNKINNP